MGRKSKISRLPPDVKAYVEGLIREGRLTLDELIANLRERFPVQEQAGELPSRAAMHRYSQAVEEQLANVRDSTQAATMFYDAFPDREDKRSAAVISMIQTQFFDAMVSLKKATAEGVDTAERLKLLGVVAKNMASLTNSSVNLKQHQSAVEADIRKQLLAEQSAKLDAMGSKGGVTEDTKKAIREALGIT